MKFLILCAFALLSLSLSGCLTANQGNNLWTANPNAARVGGTSVNWNSNRGVGNAAIRNNTTGNSRNLSWNTSNNSRSGNINVR